MGSPYVGDCITVDDEGEEVTMCEATQDFHFLIRRTPRRGGEILRTSSSLITFLPEPEDPCDGVGDAGLASCQSLLDTTECFDAGEECGIFGEMAEFCAHVGGGGAVEVVLRSEDGVPNVQIGDQVMAAVRNLRTDGTPTRGSSLIWSAQFTDEHGVEPLNENGLATCNAAQAFFDTLPPEPPEEEEL